MGPGLAILPHGSRSTAGWAELARRGDSCLPISVGLHCLRSEYGPNIKATFYPSTVYQMNIWVDADACPAVIKDILYRAAERAEVRLTLVANRSLRIPKSAYIRLLTVASGFDVADNEIVKRVAAGDLVITSDIPLAAEVIAKKGQALSPRGELFTTENIKARLNMRDFLDALRGSGINTGGPPVLSHSDRKAFADHLDRLLNQSSRTG